MGERMSGNGAVKVLSHSTPVTLALVLSLCTGCFFIGQAYTRLAVVEKNDDEMRKVLVELKELTVDNKRRLDLLEVRVHRDGR